MARKKQRSTYLLKEPNWKELSLLTDPEQRKKAISNAEYFVHYEIATKKKQPAFFQNNISSLLYAKIMTKKEES